MTFNDPREALRYHVTGAVERGEQEPIIEDKGCGCAPDDPNCAVYNVEGRCKSWPSDAGTGANPF